MAIKMIWAEDVNRMIGKNGTIPWDLPEDREFFRRKTMGHTVVMGRKTWESLPKKPLDGRMNIVITRQMGYTAPGAVVVHSKHDALAHYHDYGVGDMWVIGGGEIYNLFMLHTSHIAFTAIKTRVEGADTERPSLNGGGWMNNDPDPPVVQQSRTGLFYIIYEFWRDEHYYEK